MSGEICSCGTKFRTAEDYRDHIPCMGTEDQHTIAELRAKLVIAERRIEEVEERLALALDEPPGQPKSGTAEYWHARMCAAEKALVVCHAKSIKKAPNNQCQQEASMLGPQCQLETNHQGEHAYPITNAFLDAFDNGEWLIGRPPRKSWWKFWL